MYVEAIIKYAISDYQFSIFTTHVWSNFITHVQSVILGELPLQENIKDSEGKNRRNFVGISLFRRHTDETRRRK